MPDITVDIADDHQMIIGGLRDMIKGFNDISIGHTYNSGMALLQGLQQHQPDVLLLDIQMPDVCGDELAALISKSYPGIRILTVTGYNTADYALLMMEKGASGYLLKNTDEHKLRLAIETVYKGGKYIEPSIQDKIKDATYGTNRTVHQGRKPTLTKREKNILNLMLEEYTSQQIADKLGISLRTVEYHRSSLIQKLDTKNVIGMIKKAFQLGLVK